MHAGVCVYRFLWYTICVGRKVCGQNNTLLFHCEVAQSSEYNEWNIKILCNTLQFRYVVCLTSHVGNKLWNSTVLCFFMNNLSNLEVFDVYPTSPVRILAIVLFWQDLNNIYKVQIKCCDARHYFETHFI